ncbi:hypothetical protein Pelo_17955 [Pelomyxa schiedti]|nr:hypothetical protein Pelo_17955 [Pelomyxa schiedti]
MSKLVGAVYSAATSVASTLLPGTNKSITVAILGETGSGKSSLVELLHFWARNGDSSTPDFVSASRNSILDSSAEHGGSQSGSQTFKVTTYRFVLPHDNVKYTLNLIDTPGMGDVSGLKQDEQSVDEILTIIGDKNKTPQLHAIILMLNGAVCRVSARTNYILQRLYGLCPESMVPKLYLLFSNTQLVPNFDYKREVKVPINDDHVLSIDNLLFSPGGRQYATLSPPRKKTIEANYNACKEILVWFFGEWLKNDGVHPIGYGQLRDARNKMKLNITGTLASISEINELQAKLQEEEKELSTTVKPNLELLQQKAKMTSTRTLEENVPTDYHNTSCTAPNCRMTCHENCSLTFTPGGDRNIFRGCACMSGDTCRDCHHSFQYHLHVNYKIVKRVETISTMTPEEQQRLSEMQTFEQQKEAVLSAFNRQLCTLKREAKKASLDLTNALVELGKLCPFYEYRLELQFAIEMLKEAMMCPPKEGQSMVQRNKGYEMTIAEFNELLERWCCRCQQNVCAGRLHSTSIPLLEYPPNI